MSVIIKSTEMSYKDPDSGDYIGINVVAEKKTSEALADIRDLTSTEINAIGVKGAETLASIPDDYTALENRVDDIEDTTKIVVDSDNLFNPDTVIIGSMYYTSGSGSPAVGKTVTLVENQYTVTYGAICIPILSTYESITFRTYNSSNNSNIIGIMATGDDDVVLSYDFDTHYIYSDSYTFTLPTGATKLYVNFPVYKNDRLNFTRIMVNEGSTPKSYDGYASHYEYNNEHYQLYEKDFADNAIPIDATDFIKIHIGKNLFDYNKMVINGKMYYWNVKLQVYLVENEYTTTYAAIKIPRIDKTNSSYLILTANTSVPCYYYIFADKNDNIIAMYNGNFSISESGYTIEIPDKATTLYFNIPYWNTASSANIMVAYGNTVRQYEPYSEYFTYNGERYALYGEDPQSENIFLSVPSKYELVVGDTFELFYKGIINAVHPEDLYVEINCAKGKAYQKRYIYTPDVGDIGTYTMNIKLYNNTHYLIDEKNLSIVVKAKATSPNSEKILLYVGDSLSNSGRIPREFIRRVTQSGGTPAGDALQNITSIGTCNSSYAYFEAYGGYSFSSYNTENKLNSFMWITCQGHDKTVDDQHSTYTDSNGKYWKLETIEENRIKIICSSISGSLPASTGTLTWYSGGTHHSNIVFTASEQAAGNPFWNDTEQKVDFGWYVSQFNKDHLDYVYVLLGWNDVYKSTETYKQQVETFTSNILTDFPSCKIVLLGLEVPSYDGLAHNYGSNNYKNAYYYQMNHVWKLNALYAQIASENSSNVSFVNVAGQFDTENNMITSTRPVNVRNSQTEVYQTNGVHPDVTGSDQIADACYRDFVHKLQA